MLPFFGREAAKNDSIPNEESKLTTKIEEKL